jgi:hypothetical protein
MRREVRHLKHKAVESLVLSIELFNRPHGQGRSDAVLIHADHAFEMLLKAIIRHRGGAIRKAGEAHTLGFKECLGKCLSEAELICLTSEQAISLQFLNGWRDAAQHYLLELSEQQLYLASQGAVTLFNDLLSDVFGETLRDHVPERVLPVSTSPPRDLDLLLDDEFTVITELIGPGSRRLGDARSRLRSIAILESATAGSDHQPTDEELHGHVRELRAGRTWRDLFPGVASLQLSTSGSGLTYSLRISKKEGVPIRLVAEGDPATAVVAVKRVNELDFYSLGFRELAAHLAGVVSANKLQVVIRHLGLRDSPKYFKEMTIGRSRFARYSEEALNRLRADLPSLDVESIWQIELVARRDRRHSP